MAENSQRLLIKRKIQLSQTIIGPIGECWLLDKQSNIEEYERTFALFKHLHIFCEPEDADDQLFKTVKVRFQMYYPWCWSQVKVDKCKVSTASCGAHY